MTRPGAASIGAAVLAATDFAVILAPSVVLLVTARQGGLPRSHGRDLLVVSAIIGLVHAKVVLDRLRDEVTHAGRLGDVWIAAFDSLVVLALGATGLLLVILGGFAEQHAALLNEGWPVLLLWVGIQLLAVAIAEVSGRAIFRWLEPRGEEEPAPREPADEVPTSEPPVATR